MSRIASKQIVAYRFLTALAESDEYKDWEANQKLVQPVISKPLTLRIRRLFRVPGSREVFDLYERLYQVLHGAPLPEGGFFRSFRMATKNLIRVLPRIVGHEQADSAKDYLNTAFSVAAPMLRKIDGGSRSPIVFQKAGIAFFQAIELILKDTGNAVDMRVLPGTGRFPGIRIVHEGEGEIQKAPAIIQGVFNEEEKSLPTKAYQSTSDIDTLYTQALEAHEQQLDLLNRGKGLDAEIGARVARGDRKEKPDYTEPGPVISIGPIKKKSRVIEKTQESGEGFDNVLDFVRATIAVDTLEEVPGLMSKLRGMGVKIARRPKNRMDQPTDVGYRDLMFNVVYPNGHVGEIQVNLKKMLEAKSLGHKYYESTRTITAHKKLEGRSDLTPEEQSIIDQANSIQRNLYNEAWSQIIGTSPGYKMAKDSSHPVMVTNITYYEYEGQPAYVKPQHLPTIINSKGKEVTFYDVERFHRYAYRITHGTFLNLLGTFRKHG